MSMKNHFGFMSAAEPATDTQSVVKEAADDMTGDNLDKLDSLDDGQGSTEEYDDEEEDEDGDDDGHPGGGRRRRSSFGDAEDHMFFVHRRSIPSGLHHRRALPRMTSQAGTNSSSSGTTTNNNNNIYDTPTSKRKSNVTLPYYSSGPSTTSSSTKKRLWIRYVVVVSLGLYAILLIQTSRWLSLRTTNYNYHDASTGSLASPPPLSGRNWMGDWTLSGRSPNNNPLSSQQQQYQQQQYHRPLPSSSQQLLQQYEWSTGMMRRLHEDTQLVTRVRAASRMSRTRPTAEGTTTTTAAVPWYTVESTPSIQSSVAESIPPPPTDDRSSLDPLCGFVAQQASVSNPHHYPSKAALSKDSRVFITGLLSPLGMQLALKLHEDCGVEVIGGVDLMYPNTVAHRLALVQERLALLTARIPQLHKPVGLSYMGILPSSSSTNKRGGGHEEQDDYEILETFQPTHVIHLASYTPHQYPTIVLPPNLDPQGVGGSPYYGNASWFARQTAWWGMEQLLQGLQDMAHRPQFVYVTTTTKTETTTTVSSSTSLSTLDPVWQTIQSMEQVLVRTYQQEPALSIQLPQLYGEWDLPGSMVHDTMEHVVAQHARGHQPPAKESPLSSSSVSSTTTTLSLLHIDDALDAIVAALQYQPSRSTMTMDLSRAASPQVSTNHLVTFLESQLLNATATTPEAAAAGAEAEARILTHRDDGSGVVQPFHPALAGWQPRISLHQGLIRTMAWHLHRQNPYGKNSGSQTKGVDLPSTTNKTVTMEDADDFLIRHGQLPCEANDWNCHKSFHSPVPCLSECNTRHHCLPSIFDGIEGLTRNVTEGCQIVLYTQALGYNVKDLALQSEYMDDVDLHENDKLVCNFAFIPRDSMLVETVIGKVPTEQLTKFGIVPQVGKDMHDLKLDGLNGRLLYRGWILLWVNDATKPLSPTDQSLLKLSPSKFFHSDVERALFMADNFSVSPTLADIFFLVDQLKRRALAKRTVKKDVRAKTSFGKETVKRQKFRLPPEPPRRAAILFAPLRLPNDPHNSNIQRIRRGEKKLKLREAVKLMRHEWDLEGKETESEALQRDFYEKIPSYLNRNDLRSHQEPWYQYSMSHWVRTRWVVHDLQLEEARHLRCDWYQEHLTWGNELDQLSFAHVMAVRELKRRIAHQEPDDHVKTFIEQHPQLRDLTDSYEWHPMETDTNLLYREPVQWNSILPDHLEVEGEEESPEVDPNEPVPLFVRIISEHVMASSRRLWANEQKKKEKAKHKQ